MQQFQQFTVYVVRQCCANSVFCHFKSNRILGNIRNFESNQIVLSFSKVTNSRTNYWLGSFNSFVAPHFVVCVTDHKQGATKRQFALAGCLQIRQNEIP